jgi:hypothetical protein
MTLRQIPGSVARAMTGIQWTDFTGNAWGGCTNIPANSGGRSGCDICYAETYAGNRFGIPWGAGQPRHKFKNFHSRMRGLDRFGDEARYAVLCLHLVARRLARP